MSRRTFSIRKKMFTSDVLYLCGQVFYTKWLVSGLIEGVDSTSLFSHCTRSLEKQSHL